MFKGRKYLRVNRSIYEYLRVIHPQDFLTGHAAIFVLSTLIPKFAFLEIPRVTGRHD